MAELKDKNGIPVVRFRRLTSTSDYAKSQKEKGQDLLVFADSQKKGRGREGRSFSSKKGGLYLSWLHFPQGLPAKDGFFLVSKMSVAVCKTLESYGIKPAIKWPNDVLVDGKKICGILTENTLSGDKISCAIVGVGINVNNRLERVLRPIATSLRTEIGKKIPLKKVEEKLIENLTLPFDKADYFARLGCLGEVEIIENGTRFAAFAEGVDDEGLLIVTIDGKKEKKSAAEISLRAKGNR